MRHARSTPHDEVALVRAGNPTATVPLAGAVVGFALPVGAPPSRSRWNLLGAAVWAVVALGAELAVSTASARFLLAGWRAAAERVEVGCAAPTAATSVAVGALNPACLTP
jgi:putative membrane protein